MDDIKSAIHRLKSFAQDAAQAGRALAQSVPSPGLGGPEGWPLVWVARGKHHLTLEMFYIQFWGVERSTTPFAKKKKKKVEELKICAFHPFSFKIFR